MAELLAAGDAEVARLQAQHPDSSTVRPADLAPLLEITRQFHAAVNAGCNNPVVLRLLSLVEAFSLAARQQRLVGELDARGARDALARYDEHHRILDAVRAGDGEALERLLHDHARPTAAV
jgi:DNA-binding GntR family transcriptional regulator